VLDAFSGTGGRRARQGSEGTADLGTCEGLAPAALAQAAPPWPRPALFDGPRRPWLAEMRLDPLRPKAGARGWPYSFAILIQSYVALKKAGRAHAASNAAGRTSGRGDARQRSYGAQFFLLEVVRCSLTRAAASSARGLPIRALEFANSASRRFSRASSSTPFEQERRGRLLGRRLLSRSQRRERRRPRRFKFDRAAPGRR